MEHSVRHNTSGNATGLVTREFRQRYGEPTGIFRAPGRVNLIGEHTDYNDGFVMPAAIGFYTTIAASARADRRICVYSVDFAESAEFSLDDLIPSPTDHWTDYVRGVAGMLLAKGAPLQGASLVIKGEVPIGAGLSSSAAIEVATAFALLGVAGIALDRRVIAAICQRAEHEYAGTKCGIMDQFISCFGQANHALLLDCRSLEYKPLALASGVRIVICNTMVKHELASGEYNARRVDCEAGVKFLQGFLPHVRALRDVSLSQLEEFGSGMPDRIYRRCRHVLGENERTIGAASALEGGDLVRFGVLMGESHASLRDDYEVSCRELDLIVELAGECPGVFGSRMTGGGFGGCTVNLIEEDAVGSFQRDVSSRYEAAVGVHPDIYVCMAADGAAEVTGQSA
jgi:galactokinase